ncbi:MAG: hypothetical protein M1829_000668 [Trizodia sp. TS-e1964]|nr:MAG: hypothetical protein M1829_000668 [Trizodia sp. TS-e1964]
MALNPPEPEASASDYTELQLNKRLLYVHSRRILPNATPRCAIFYDLYEQTVASALEEIQTEESQNRARDSLHLYDKFIQASPFLSRIKTPEEAKVEANLLKLKQLEFNCRYGYYLGKARSAFREHALKPDTSDAKVLQHYWTTHWKLFKAEQMELYSRTTFRMGEFPTLRFVWGAAKSLNFPTKRVEWIMKVFSENHDRALLGIFENFLNGQWAEVAEALYNDLNDLRLVIPPKWKMILSSSKN